MEDETMTFSEWQNGQSQDISPTENEEANEFDNNSAVSFDQFQMDQFEEQEIKKREAEEFEADVKAKREEIKNAAKEYNLPEWWIRTLKGIKGSTMNISEGFDNLITDAIIDTYDEVVGGNRSAEEKRALADKVFSLGGILPNTDADIKERFGDPAVDIAASFTDYGTIVDEDTGEVRQKDFVDLIGEDDYKAAADNLASNLVQAGPSVLIAMTGLGGVAVLGASAAGG